MWQFLALKKGNNPGIVSQGVQDLAPSPSGKEEYWLKA